MDVFVTEENDLAFKAYGQSYTYQECGGVLTALVTVTCFGEGRSAIDMSKVFTPPTQALQKDLSM